jgi:hypothetical protein
MPTDARTLPENRLWIDVQVLVDGTWWPGALEHRRRRDGRWEGWVRYTTGLGETRLGWFDCQQLRPVDVSAHDQRREREERDDRYQDHRDHDHRGR